MIQQSLLSIADFVKSNIPLTKIFQYNEIGYIEEVLKGVVGKIHPDEFEFWLIFRLANDSKEIKLPKSDKKQIIFIVGDESDFIPTDIVDSVFAVFRQYLPDDVKISNMFHLPVGPSRASSELPVKPIQQRKYNVFFSGNLHLGRAELYKNFTRLRVLPFSVLHRVQSLRQKEYDDYYPTSFLRFSKGFHRGINFEAYANMLNDSKIALCPYGLRNPETMRHFEAIRAGSVVITKSLPKHECYVRAPFIVVEYWSELDECVTEVLNSPHLLEDYHSKTLNWWNEKCSPEAVANNVINTIMQLNNCISTE